MACNWTGTSRRTAAATTTGTEADAGGGGLVQPLASRQLAQGSALLLGDDGEDPELLRAQPMGAQAQPHRLLDPASGGRDQEADGLVGRGLILPWQWLPRQVS